MLTVELKYNNVWHVDMYWAYFPLRYKKTKASFHFIETISFSINYYKGITYFALLIDKYIVL